MRLSEVLAEEIDKEQSHTWKNIVELLEKVELPFTTFPEKAAGLIDTQENIQFRDLVKSISSFISSGNKVNKDNALQFEGNIIKVKKLIENKEKTRDFCFNAKLKVFISLFGHNNVQRILVSTDNTYCSSKGVLIVVFIDTPIWTEIKKQSMLLHLIARYIIDN